MTRAQSDVVLERLMSLHPKIIDLTLDRMVDLLDKLGNPQDSIPPVIHIAGTNGKGSTLAMIRAGLEGAGQSVHTYTSPHLARFHERIRLAGTLIPEDDLAAVLAECEEINGGIPITYFEITTCAAFLAYSRIKADYTLLEVGLGGRLDATNVIPEPALTVITPVSVDHEAFLGDTIEKIAFEKAGILKRNTFCVVAKQDDAAMEVIERQAAKVGATIKAYGQHWHVTTENGRLVYQDENGLLELPMPALMGQHQIENAGTAIAALRLLGMDETAASAAATNAEWPARMQRLKSGPLVDLAGHAELWLDGGHNPAAGAALASVLDGLADKPTFMITGMLNTKDIGGYLAPLANHAVKLYGVSIPGEAATLSGAETVAKAVEVGMDGEAADSVADAIAAIVADNPSARILICGSLYLAGKVLVENS